MEGQFASELLASSAPATLRRRSGEEEVEQGLLADEEEEERSTFLYCMGFLRSTPTAATTPIPCHFFATTEPHLLRIAACVVEAGVNEGQPIELLLVARRALTEAEWHALAAPARIMHEQMRMLVHVGGHGAACVSRLIARCCSGHKKEADANNNNNNNTNPNAEMEADGATLTLCALFDVYRMIAGGRMHHLDKRAWRMRASGLRAVRAEIGDLEATIARAVSARRAATRRVAQHHCALMALAQLRMSFQAFVMMLAVRQQQRPRAADEAEEDENTTTTTTTTTTNNNNMEEDGDDDDDNTNNNNNNNNNSSSNMECETDAAQSSASTSHPATIRMTPRSEEPRQGMPHMMIGWEHLQHMEQHAHALRCAEADECDLLNQVELTRVRVRELHSVLAHQHALRRRRPP